MDLKQLLRKEYQGLVDILVDKSYTYYNDVFMKLPESMSDKEKFDMIQKFLDGQLNTIKSQLNTINLEGMIKK